jgi:hypothetical protein
MLQSIARFTMSKVILAEYDAKAQTLKLPEPLPGVKDRERVPLSISGRERSGRAIPQKVSSRYAVKLEGWAISERMAGRTRKYKDVEALLRRVRHSRKTQTKA